MTHRFRLQTVCAFLLSLCALQSAHAGPPAERIDGPGWTYFRLGHPNDIQTATRPGILFEGGGKDVNDAYKWMCKRSGNGDFLVIRTTGTDAYNKYIQRLCPAINSASTLIIKSKRGASDPFVRKTMMQAEALFIAGGDQSDYVRFWQNTPVNHVIDTLARNGAPVGGTSAGNAILARFAFAALKGPVISHVALADPFGPQITIDEGFLRFNPLLKDRITDDHFVTRNRMGRLVTFLARIAQNGTGRRPRAIATDENAAFLVDPTGRGRLFGQGAAYFVSTPGKPETCQPGKPLTFTNLQVYKITEGGTFDIRTWTGTGGTTYKISANDGVMSSTQTGGSLY